MKKLLDFSMFITLILFLAHLFACIWVFLGLREMEINGDGWISANSDSEVDIQLTDWDSLYISGIYWVFTTFSSVGYGDIKGNTKHEYLFQIVVEIIGMGFFGYLTGSF